MPRVVRSPTAQRDLEQLAEYIGLDNPAAATEFIDRIDQKFQLLAQFQGVGSKRDELLPGLRSLPVGMYIIFYLPMADGVQVVRVLHGRRNIREIFRLMAE